MFSQYRAFFCCGVLGSEKFVMFFEIKRTKKETFRAFEKYTPDNM
jgi:hypothetical protein